jgi:hypothetical protein
MQPVEWRTFSNSIGTGHGIWPSNRELTDRIAEEDHPVGDKQPDEAASGDLQNGLEQFHFVRSNLRLYFTGAAVGAA